MLAPSSSPPLNGSVKIIPYEQLGHADHGWLDARHHFSFAHYYDPQRLGFGSLLVVNDDRIAPGKGFGMHPHDNMEIITYVRTGAISHKDSVGNEGRTAAGDVQVMSAGSGVRHSEHNLENSPTTLYQIWIRPNKSNVAPRWEAKNFPKTPMNDRLNLLASGQAEHKDLGALHIYADAALFGGRLLAGAKLAHPVKHQAYVLASEGEFYVNGALLKPGDGAEVSGTNKIEILARTNAELLVIDVPA